MLSVIIETNNNTDDLVYTLYPLVQGSVCGLVKTVTLVVGSENAHILEIGESTGCDIIHQTNPGEIIAQISGPWLLKITAGHRFSENWIEAFSQYIALEKQPIMIAPTTIRWYQKYLPFNKSKIDHALLMPTQYAAELIRQKDHWSTLYRHTSKQFKNVHLLDRARY